MTTDAERIQTTVPRGSARALVGLSAVVLPVFAATIALSAFLLFTVEPLVGRLTLPTFGGTPSVWATVLFFFQSVLLVGYAYGHLSATRLGPRRGAIVHVILALLAVAALSLAPARIGDAARRRAAGRRQPRLDPDPHDRRPGPADHRDHAAAELVVRRDPIGRRPARRSVLALRAEQRGVVRGPARLPVPHRAVARSRRPAVGLGSRGRGSRRLSRRLCLARPPTGSSGRGRRGCVGPGDRSPPPRPGPARSAGDDAARWLLLAAVPSGLLSAVTNFITTDLISAPLLWVVPLAIYLLTFVIAFSERGRRIVPGAEWLAPAAVTLLWVPFGSAAGWPIGPLLLVEFAGLAIVATTLHGRLAADRPAPEHLTEFYLVMSAGGVLASSLVAVVAPTLFKGIWEYPLLLILALGAMALVGGPAAAAPAPGPRRRFDLSPFFAGAPARLAPYVVVAGLLGLGLVASGSLGLEAGVRWLLVGGLILLVGGQPRFLFVSTALVLALAVFVLSPAAVFQDRSFFGVTLVLRPADQPLTILMNGTTVHGIQSSDPAARSIPGSYYAPHGPLGEVFGLARSRPGAEAGRTIGVVGLGSGTVAAWARPGDALTFYEIDPLVIRVASDPAYFTWLSDAAVRPEIVLGDARLSLESVPGPTYDVLVLDAFSSDAIPAHLLTTEALADDARVLRPGGLLAIHVSNRYYDLGPAVASAARAAGLTVLERVYEPSAADRRLNAALSDWLIGTTDPSDVPRLEAAGWRTVREGVTPLTDDHPDLLRLLRIGLW